MVRAGASALVAPELLVVDDALRPDRSERGHGAALDAGGLSTVYAPQGSVPHLESPSRLEREQGPTGSFLLGSRRFQKHDVRVALDRREGPKRRDFRRKRADAKAHHLGWRRWANSHSPPAREGDVRAE